jgi:hypothetical protein
MSIIPLEELEKDPRLFDLVHGIREDRVPAFSVAHEMLDTSLTQAELSLQSRVATDLGIRTFEVVTGEVAFTDIRIVDVIRYGVQGEKTGNFLLHLLDDMHEAGLRLPDTAPELAEASERFVVAHLPDANASLIFQARAGAGIMHELFTEAYLSGIVGRD